MFVSELIFFLGYPLDCPGDDERLEAGYTEEGGANRRISIKPIGRALSAKLILQMSGAHWGPGVKPPPLLIPGSIGHSSTALHHC